jgi:hypothetical protein
MYLAVMHRIHDPGGGAEALASDHTYPTDFHLHSFVDAQDSHVAQHEPSGWPASTTTPMSRNAVCPAPDGET